LRTVKPISKFDKRQATKIAGLLVTTILLFGACEKQVSINLGSSPPIVVVQGQIQTGNPPVVMLTTTISFFSNINLATLESTFIHKAVVTVYDGSRTITLKEYALDTGANSKFYFYSIDTANLSNIMLGETGKFYTLKIVSNGNTYTSVTKIPNPKGIDSMWFGKPVYTNKNTPDSAFEIYVNYTDPDTPGNYVRTFTKRNSEPYYADGLFSDQVVNGLVIKNIDLYAGYLDSVNVKVDTLMYFYPGDTVTLNWCQIDKGVYDFWNTEIYANRAQGNPFASPINVKTNIEGGAIGIWAGYSNSFTTKIVP